MKFKKQLSFILIITMLFSIITPAFADGSGDGVVKTHLQSSLTSAIGNRDGTSVSTDGADVEPSNKWVTQYDLDVYDAVIASADTINIKVDATQPEVDNAKNELDTATDVFNLAKQDGIKVSSGDIVDKAELQSALMLANENKNTAIVSVDGSDVEPSNKWVTQENMETYLTSINTAQEVHDNGDAIQTEINDAKNELDVATDAFNSAKQDGIKVSFPDPVIIKYVIGSDATEYQASLEKIGTYDYSGNIANAYLASLPEGATIKSMDWDSSVSMFSRYSKEGAKTYRKNNFIFNDEEKYIIDEEFIDSNFNGFAGFLANENNTSLNLSESYANFPSTDVKGFITKVIFRPSTKFYYHILYVQIKNESSSSINKNDLAETIAIAPKHDDLLYYHEKDRYNGKEYVGKEDSFWDKMQEAISHAQIVYDNDNASQLNVDDANNNLKDAIAKLIPKENVNPTEFYEAINNGLRKANYTQESLPPYNSALAEAEALLDSLYNEDGVATEKNKGNDQELLDEITQKITAISEAIDGLDFLVRTDGNMGTYPVEQAAMVYRTLGDLLRVYNPLLMEQEKYTAESWEAYVNLHDEILEYLNNSIEPGAGGRELGEKELDLVQRTYYPELRRAIHRLEDKKNSIKVTIKVIDNFAARVEFPLADVFPSITMHEKSGIYHLTLEGDRTLNTAIDMLGDEILSDTSKIHPDTRIFCVTSINDVLTMFPSSEAKVYPLSFKTPSSGAQGSFEYYNLQLHDGDVVTLAFLEQPYKSSSSGIGWDALDERSYHDHYKQTAILQNGGKVEEVIEIKEGEPLNLSAIYTLPHVSNYSLSPNPLLGARIFVSEAADSVSAIKPSNIKTSVETGAGGTFDYTFYSPGYYALSVFDLGENTATQGYSFDFDGVAPGLNIGDTVYVHVEATSAEQLEVIKVGFKQELTSVYGEYPESYFSAEDWVEINNLYNTGISGIEGASTLSDAKNAQNAAMNGIKVIQNRTIGENTSKLASFRSLLSRLPDDLSLLGAYNSYLAEGLIEAYTTMSDYQKNQITGFEDGRYNAVKEVYDAGLSQNEPYALTMTIDADRQIAKEAIEEMLDYVKTNGHDPTFLYEFGVAQRNLLGGSGNQTVGVVAYPDNKVTFAASIGAFVNSFTDEVSGNGWSIQTDGPTINEGIVVKNKTILVTGIPYEIKTIRVNGVDQIDLSGKRIKNAQNQNITFNETFNSFVMPYQDVDVTVTWGPVSQAFNPGDTTELIAAKVAAENAVNSAYSLYNSSDYSVENWSQLVNAKNAAIYAITAAETVEEVNIAKDNAISAMAVIGKKNVSGSIPIFGKEEPIVGYLDVYVENTTYSGGNFTGTIVSEVNFPYAESDTMMTIILRALAQNGYGWTGSGGSVPMGRDDYGIAYLSSITKEGKSLGEFDGSAASGWMGTLNDFFVNEGFSQFKVKDGKVSNGDEIKAMFTMSLGIDLGGTWGNSDTSLKQLVLSSGTLFPAFSPDIKEYTIILLAGTSSIKVTPTAANRNYLVKTFLNDKVTSNAEGASFYKRTQYIPVRSGDYINIGVGEYAWPSMNNQETEARYYTGTWYKFNIMTADKGAEQVKNLIDKLPILNRITLSDKETIQGIRNLYNLLPEIEKSKVTNIQKLVTGEERITFLQAIEEVKNLLKKIPEASRVTLSDKNNVMAADAAYKKLTDEQKLYITVGDVKNYNDAIKKLTELGAFTSGSTPTPIAGSTLVPVITGGNVDVKAETTVSNGSATSKVSETQIKEIVAEALKGNDVSSFTIKGTDDKTVTKSNLEIPKAAITEIANGRLDLNIETALGTITIPNTTLQKISQQAGESSVSMVMEKVDTEKLTPEQKEAVKDSSVYDISIITGTSKISSFGGESITISLPYELKAGEVKDKVAVWYMNDKGELEQKVCTYYPSTGMATFKTDHLSYYMIGYDTTIPVFTITFRDVKESDWFFPAVKYAAEKGLFKGTTETTFSPNNSMTRGMVVSVLHRLAGEPMGNMASFTDVSSSDWYSSPVGWAAANNVVSGYGEGQFRPNDNVTREQLAGILQRYAVSKGYDVSAKADLNVYSDASSISSWARDAISWANAEGLISGRSATTLAPGGTATRAEVAAILQRFVEKFGEK